MIMADNRNIKRGPKIDYGGLFDDDVDPSFDCGIERHISLKHPGIEKAIFDALKNGSPNGYIIDSVSLSEDGLTANVNIRFTALKTIFQNQITITRQENND